MIRSDEAADRGLEPQQARGRDAALLLLASVVSGLLGYVVLWAVIRFQGEAAYASFAAFWSALYLIIGSLAGLQQEFARATAPAVGRPATRFPWAVLAGATAATLLIVLASSPLWVPTVFPVAGASILVPLAVGAAASVVVAIVTGIAAGGGAWRLVAAVMVIDVGLRLVTVGIGAALGVGIVGMAWLVALPLPAMLLLLAPWMRRRLKGATTRDLPDRRIAINSLLLVAASASTATVVSGMPLLISATSSGEPTAVIGSVVFAVTLVRAPIIVTSLSLQSLLVVRMRRSERDRRRTVVIGLAVIGAVSAIGVGLALTVAPQLVDLIVVRTLGIGGHVYAALVLSSALVGVLCITGAALVSAKRHVANMAGWIATAIVTIVVVLLPIDFEARVLSALLVPPCVGILVHLGAAANRATASPSRS